jgi:hypothetical protein
MAHPHCNHFRLFSAFSALYLTKNEPVYDKTKLTYVGLEPTASRSRGCCGRSLARYHCASRPWEVHLIDLVGLQNIGKQKYTE